MIKIFKEPLVHFLLIAAGIFLISELFSGVNSSESSQQDEILITQAQIKMISKGFEKTWQRTPSKQELETAIEVYIREEVFYREALAMGLDRNDGIVRRRLSQKIQFLTEDLASLEKPEDEVLNAFLTTHADDYLRPARFSFKQVFLNTSKRGASAQTDAANLLKQLNVNDINAADLGDSLMVAHQFADVAEHDVSRSLGDDFLKAITTTPKGSWQGPVKSGFGLHLVRIDNREQQMQAELSEVRDAVLRDWKSEKLKLTNEAVYNSMRSQYKISVESETLKSVDTKLIAKG